MSPAGIREFPRIKTGNSDAFFREKRLTKNKQLHEAVIGAYEQAISQGQDTVAKHHGMQAPEGQPMEMAGM